MPTQAYTIHHNRLKTRKWSEIHPIDMREAQGRSPKWCFVKTRVFPLWNDGISLHAPAGQQFLEISPVSTWWYLMFSCENKHSRVKIEDPKIKRCIFDKFLYLLNHAGDCIGFQIFDFSSTWWLGLYLLLLKCPFIIPQDIWVEDCSEDSHDNLDDGGFIWNHAWLISVQGLLGNHGSHPCGQFLGQN